MLYVIVDDCLQILNYISEFFSTQNLRSMIASEFDLAVDIVKKNAGQQITILIDICLGNQNGFDLASKIREIDSSIRIVLMSGYVIKTTSFLIKMQDLKIDGFLQKPISTDNLANCFL